MQKSILIVTEIQDFYLMVGIAVSGLLRKGKIHFVINL